MNHWPRRSVRFAKEKLAGRRPRARPSHGEPIRSRRIRVRSGFDALATGSRHGAGRQRWFSPLHLAAADGATDTVVRLEYQADEQGGCVGEDELRRMVTDQLGHDPFRPDADQRVAISIAKTDAGFQGRIVWTEADGRPVGQRLLSSRSRDCREIAANVAFAVALAAAARRARRVE